MLAFQVATTYGLDKSTMQERLDWDAQQLGTNLTCLTRSYCTLRRLEGADEPWLFLAACEEYYHCAIIKDRLTTSLPVATDATCSGLQILDRLGKG